MNLTNLGGPGRGNEPKHQHQHPQYPQTQNYYPLPYPNYDRFNSNTNSKNDSPLKKRHTTFKPEQTAEEVKTSSNFLYHHRLSKYGKFDQISGDKGTDGSKLLSKEKTEMLVPQVTIKQTLTRIGPTITPTNYEVDNYHDKFWQVLKRRPERVIEVTGRKSPTQKQHKIVDPYSDEYWKLPKKNKKTLNTEDKAPTESYVYYNCDGSKRTLSPEKKRGYYPNLQSNSENNTPLGTQSNFNPMSHNNLNDYYKQGLFDRQLNDQSVIDPNMERDKIVAKLRTSGIYNKDNKDNKENRDSQVKISVEGVNKDKEYGKKQKTHKPEQSTVSVYSKAKERNLDLKIEDYLNFIKASKDLSNNENHIKDLLNRMIETHVNRKIGDIGQEAQTKASTSKDKEDPYEFNILSFDNREGYLLDFNLIKNFDWSKFKQYSNVMPKINYYIVEPIPEIAEYLKDKAKEISALQSKNPAFSRFHVQVVEADLNDIELDSGMVSSSVNFPSISAEFFKSKKFEVVVLNRCVDRIISSGSSIDEFLSKVLILVTQHGELAFFADQLEGKLMVREFYNTSLSNSSNTNTERPEYIHGLINNKNILINSTELSAERIWDTVVQNERFLSRNKFLIGMKHFTDLVDISDCINTTPQGVHLMCKMVQRRIIKIEEINRVKKIVQAVSHVDKNDGRSFIVEKVSGFFFKKSLSQEEEGKEELDFFLPKGVERLLIVEKKAEESEGELEEKEAEQSPGKNRKTPKKQRKLLVKKKFFYTNGSKEIIETVS